MVNDEWCRFEMWVMESKRAHFYPSAFSQNSHEGVECE